MLPATAPFPARRTRRWKDIMPVSYQGVDRAGRSATLHDRIAWELGRTMEDELSKRFHLP